MELMILDSIFGQLSPENLCGDGEIPRWRVNEKRKQLDRELNAVYVLLGQVIDESQHYEIMEKFNSEIVKSVQQSLQWQQRRETALAKIHGNEPAVLSTDVGGLQ
jgi:hypothetical protein